jgi:prevent-host-death family protein
MGVPQIEPVTSLSRDYRTVFSKLEEGPVFLAQRSRPAAVLLSVSDYKDLLDRLEDLEDLAEIYKGKWLLATGQETMTRLSEEETAEWAGESNAVLA